MLGLRTVIYKVADMDAAKAWYSQVFQTQPYFDEPFYIGYSIGGFELGLHPVEGAVTKGENVVVYWGVEDINSEYERVLGLGAVAYEAPMNVGGDIMVAAVKDPWGNVLGLIYNPGFGKESVAGH